MTPLIPVSVSIITLNEEENISKLLKQLVDFEEVILVDSGSTDGTLKIAKAFSNVKSTFREWSGFSDQKSFALSLCSHEWVLNLDADEEMTSGYLDELLNVLHENHVDALESRRILLRRGKRPRNFMRDDVLIRFFRKNCGHYEFARVHEKITIEGNIKHTDEKLLHHENLTFSQRILKSNQYSQLKAEDKYSNGKRCHMICLIMIFPWSFLQCYLGKGCFLDGCEGLITSMNHAYYNFMKYAKLWELSRSI